VLVVVLLAMIALLGMGLTGLYLTSGSIQMSSNINMRNQALYVAEAGIQTAKSILNRTITGNVNWAPNLNLMLQGGFSVGGNPVALPDGFVDEIPATPTECLGSDANGNLKRGAYLRDDAPFGCQGASGFSQAYVNCNYPPAGFNDPNDPNGPQPLNQFMGRYTLFVRQDLADCRMGYYNFENNDPASGLPLTNGIVVIRSEGVASDNRTKVVLEVTMAPNPNVIDVPSQIVTVCSAGAAGCDDNASVQQGITVAGALGGTYGNTGTGGGGGGAGGTGGAGGAGGTGGTGGTAGAGGTTPLGGSGGGGGTGGGAGTGGTGGGGNGGTGGHGGTGGCNTSKCPNVAVLGVDGIWDTGTNGSNTGMSQFFSWLATHSNNCAPQQIYIDDHDPNNNPITADTLKPYNVIVLLDLYHTRAQYRSCVANVGSCQLQYSSYATGQQRHLSDDELDAFRTWVEGNVSGQISGGHGFVATIGYHWYSHETYNVNGILKRFNLAYQTDGSGGVISEFIGAGLGVDLTVATTGAASTIKVSSPPPPPMAGVQKLHISSGTPLQVISSWPAYDATPTRYALGFDTNGAGYDIGYLVDRIGTKGRINAWADEWITYDDVWSSSMQVKGVTYQTEQYWENVVKWIGQCPP